VSEKPKLLFGPWVSRQQWEFENGPQPQRPPRLEPLDDDDPTFVSPSVPGRLTFSPRVPKRLDA